MKDLFLKGMRSTAYRLVLIILETGDVQHHRALWEYGAINKCDFIIIITCSAA